MIVLTVYPFVSSWVEKNKECFDYFRCLLGVGFDERNIKDYCTELADAFKRNRSMRDEGHGLLASSVYHYCEQYTKAKQLWADFGDVCVDEDEAIDEEFLDFPVGTDKYEIWHWFEESFSLSIAQDFMGME